MFGFNWVDLIILLLLGLAIYKGMQIGLSVQLFIVVGFFGGLFLAGWTFPHLLPIHDRTLLTIVNGNLVLIFAVYLAIKGLDLGMHFRYLLGEGKLYKVESKAGILVSIAAVLVLVWLLGSVVGRLPFEGLSNSFNDARIIRTMNENLPQIPAVFAVFNKQVNPNAPPYVFGGQPTELSPLINTPEFRIADNRAKQSTVRITSFGCGGVVSGSGFVIGPGLVATNAHVIAGVKNPIIKYNNHSYSGYPVLFNPNVDFAILKVDDLPAAPLDLVTSDIPVDTAVSVLGYPGGNYRLSGGKIHENIILSGRNIYDLGLIDRDVYEIQTKVDSGSSGGPVITSDGRVAAVLFAKSDIDSTYGYAVTTKSLLGEINQGRTSTARIGTGSCLAN